MYRKSIRTKRLEAKRKRCAAMRASKERKRMERVSAMTDVGGITTDGILGEHSMGAEGWRGRPAMNGKGSARRRTSDARKYADGWRRVFGRKRVRRDSGGNAGHSCPPQ